MKVSFFGYYALQHTREGRFATDEESFRHFKKLGTDYCDIFTSCLSKYPLTYYLESARNAGVDAGCLISFENIADKNPVERKKYIMRTKEQIDLMHKHSIPMMMLAPQTGEAENSCEFEAMREYLVEGFSEIVNYAKDSGICVALENQSLYRRPDSKIADIRYILDNVEGLGYVLDTGNFYCVNEDVLEAYNALKDRLVHVHCKDWKKDPFGDFVREHIPRFRGCALGQGEVPLAQLIAQLKKDGYKGLLTAEVNSPITWEEMDSCIEFLKTEIER